MAHIELVSQRIFAKASTGKQQEGAFLYLRRRYYNAFTLALGDALALGIALLAAGAVRFWWFGDPLIPYWSWYLPLAWWCGALLTGLLPSWGLGPVVELRRLTVLLFAVYASAAVMLFLSKQTEASSRLTVTLALCFSLFTIPLMRLRIKRLLIAFNMWGIPTVLYGAGRTGADIARLLRKERGLGYNLIGAFDDDENSWGKKLGDVRVLGGTDLITPRAPVAIVALPNIGRARLIELLEGPLSYYRTVLIIPDLFEAPSLWVRPCDLNGILGLEITSNLTSPLAQFVKRTTDVVTVLVAAPLWIPLCAVLALLVWLEDRHNPFFLQQRIGRKGKRFKAWKFRTMVPNAEEVLHQELEEDSSLRQEWETFFKLRKDPRLTRIGRLMRRFSLDELPQLINVLRGEMSLVGPRPLPYYHHSELPPRVCELRERVRPGITGLWQISGRSDAGTKGMEKWDPYYVRNWSLWLDIVILIRTGRIVFNGSGAY